MFWVSVEVVSSSRFSVFWRICLRRVELLVGDGVGVLDLDIFLLDMTLESCL